MKTFQKKNESKNKIYKLNTKEKKRKTIDIADEEYEIDEAINPNNLK